MERTCHSKPSPAAGEESVSSEPDEVWADSYYTRVSVTEQGASENLPLTSVDKEDRKPATSIDELEADYEFSYRRTVVRRNKSYNRYIADDIVQ